MTVKVIREKHFKFLP